MTEQNCNQCALKTIMQGMCPIFHADMTNQKGCPHFQKELKSCELCGNIMIEPATLIPHGNNTYREICSNCASASPCATCSKNNCAFETDTSCQEPPYIMVRKQQGNMIIQSQQINPKRVDATCRKGCPCFYESEAKEVFCRRSLQCGCDNYQMI